MTAICLPLPILTPAGSSNSLGVSHGPIEILARKVEVGHYAAMLTLHIYTNPPPFMAEAIAAQLRAPKRQECAGAFPAKRSALRRNTRRSTSPDCEESTKLVYVVSKYIYH